MPPLYQVMEAHSAEGMQLTRGRGAPLPTGQPAPSSSQFVPVVCLFLTAGAARQPFLRRFAAA